VTSTGSQSICSNISDWRQGDCVLNDDAIFYYVAAAEADNETGEISSELSEIVGDDKIVGFVIVSQTCDIVRSIKDVPYVEVCPLIIVEEEKVKQAQGLAGNHCLFIPTLEKLNIVGDMDCTMTVEKKMLLYWVRKAGWTHDEEVRKIQWSLSRKRKRFAFPDDFNDAIRRMRDNFQRKHSKKVSPEGALMRGLDEIRVMASPNWDAPLIKLFFWFIKKEKEDQQALVDRASIWLKKFDCSGRFQQFDCECDYNVCEYCDLTAKEYLTSDRLDLEFLSKRLE
jgi:hypothetical protein